MKRILGAIAAGLLAVGLLLPATSSPLSSLSDSQETLESAAGDRLVELGPVELVAAAYTNAVSVPCVLNKRSGDLGCGQTLNPSTADFVTSGSTIVSITCTGINGFHLYAVTQCSLNGSGNLQLKFEVSKSVPCDGVIFATVQLTNTNGDTLLVSIGHDNNAVTNCST
ncbi:MAG: hypothetical protein ACI8Y4_001254 [Candidatus Poriferisodalaceae bacterium]|jgi:hypothetical protein